MSRAISKKDTMNKTLNSTKSGKKKRHNKDFKIILPTEKLKKKKFRYFLYYKTNVFRLIWRLSYLFMYYSMYFRYIKVNCFKKWCFCSQLCRVSKKIKRKYETESILYHEYKWYVHIIQSYCTHRCTWRI